MVLPKFKLTLVQVKPLAVTEHKRGTEQTGTAADLCASAAELKDAGGDLAYVLHTSGTTGHPKIVRVPHKCILPNVLHLRSVIIPFCHYCFIYNSIFRSCYELHPSIRSLFQVSADDVVFLASPLTFDPSVVEIFLALSSGAQLLIIPAVIKKMPNRLAQLLFKNHQTTVLQARVHSSETVFC